MEVIKEGIGQYRYWYEDSCWKCGTCRTEVPVKQRTRYPNVSDTAWACPKCNDEITKEYETLRDDQRKRWLSRI